MAKGSDKIIFGDDSDLYKPVTSADRGKAYLIVLCTIVILSGLVYGMIGTPTPGAFKPAENRTVITNIKDQAKEPDADK